MTEASLVVKWDLFLKHAFLKILLWSGTNSHSLSGRNLVFLGVY